MALTATTAIRMVQHLNQTTTVHLLNQTTYTHHHVPQPTQITQCITERDYGMIPVLQDDRTVFCNASGPTQVTVFDAGDQIDLKAAVFHGFFRLNLSQATIAHPIASMANDGGNHDPRFIFQHHHIACQCPSMRNTSLYLWQHAFGKNYTRDHEPLSTQCSGLDHEITTRADVEIADKAILMARRDDHNPFFQIAATYNAWIMMQVLGWNPRVDNIQLIHLDSGYPTAIDVLQHRMLASRSSEIVAASEWINKTLSFTQPVLLSPFETSGPMMQHLNDDEPCGKTQLLADFRQQALQSMGVTAVTNQPKLTVTVISRRDYQGRRVQRHWLNEDEILMKLRQEYPSVHFQSIDFVRIPLEMQMQVILQSHVIIGMHGAGMVNVLWSQPETVVIEIFPKRRKRWGYRNLCQWIGCQWHEFRGGRDTGRGDNASDKRIPYDEWKTFFDPLLQQQRQRITNVNDGGTAE